MPQEKGFASLKKKLTTIGDGTNFASIYLLIAAMCMKRRKMPEKWFNLVFKTSYIGWATTAVTRGITSGIDEYQRAPEEAALDNNLNLKRALTTLSIGSGTISLLSSPLNRLPFTRVSSLIALDASSMLGTITKYWGKSKLTTPEKFDYASQILNIIGLTASIPTWHYPQLSPLWSYAGWAASSIPNSLAISANNQPEQTTEKVATLGAATGTASLLSAVATKNPFVPGVTSLVALSSKVFTNSAPATSWVQRISQANEADRSKAM